MKAHYKTRTGRLTFEVEGTVKEVFRLMAEISEIFDIAECGACRSPDVRLRVRTNDGNEFYEAVCASCRARLAFGQNKDQKGLFPKRKDADGNYLEHAGWVVWTGESKTREAGS